MSTDYHDQDAYAAGKLRHLYPSMVSTLTTCAARARYRYWLGLKQPPAVALDLGSAFDAGMTAYYEDRWHGRRTSSDKAMAVAVEDFDQRYEQNREAYPPEDEDARSRSECLSDITRTIPAFVEMIGRPLRPHPKLPPQSTLELNVPGLPTILGTVDMPEELAGGETVLHDTKTARKKWPMGKEHGEWQPLFYTYMANVTLGVGGAAARTFAFDVAAFNTRDATIETRNVVVDAPRLKKLPMIAKAAARQYETFAQGELPLPARGSFLCSRKLCGYWKVCEDEYGGTVK